MLGDYPGICPICPFPLSRPIKSTYEEQSRMGPRHDPDLARKKWETPGFWKTPLSLASLKYRAIIVRYLRKARPPAGAFGPFGPEVHLGVSKRVSPKIGVCPEVSGEVPLGPF